MRLVLLKCFPVDSKEVCLQDIEEWKLILKIRSEKRKTFLFKIDQITLYLFVAMPAVDMTRGLENEK